MYNWKSIILKSNDTLEKAISLLESEALRIVLVSDDEGRLLGTVTDGDVRRALIHHHAMSDLLKDVMFKEPTVAFINDDKEVILAMMKCEDLLQIPIIDQDRKIVGLETIQHLLTQDRLDNPIFLMAGGFGTRLQPLTNNIPKPLLTVGTRPILETILNQFIEMGFHNFYISTHYKAEMVRNHFGTGNKWGVNIQYIHEEQPLGTAGALGLLPENVSSLPMIVMNGDILTKVNFEQLLFFHERSGGMATMCVRDYDFQVPYGVVQSEKHRIKSIVEKPVHKFFVNAGIYVLEQQLVRNIEFNSYTDMPDLLENEIKKDTLVNMFPIHEYWMDIGRMDDLEVARSDMVNNF